MFYVYLSSWVLQDGNYPDFYVGQEAEFALEFWFEQDFKISENSKRSIEHLKDTIYRVNAEVVVISEDIWVIDCGLHAYQKRKLPEDFAAGQFICGEVGLGIDSYLYFESMSKDDRFPPMIYSWKVVKIMQQTAPYIKQVHIQPGIFQGKEVLVRDPSKLGYVSIDRTNAWKDDKGVAEYILVCEKLDIPPKRTSKTAT